MKRVAIKKEFDTLAREIREDIIKMLSRTRTCSPTSLGIVDVLIALYFGALKKDSRKPTWDERDRVFISNDSLAPARYAALAHAGYFSKRELASYGSKRLPTTPNRNVPGVEIANPSLGTALSISIGSALFAKIEGKKHHTYCIIGDGEHNLGQVWEAILFASKHKLRLTAIIDRNNTQQTGYTETILPLESLRAKYEAFNWHVIEADGHNIHHVIDALVESKTANKPCAIIAHTIPGKGVSFLENRPEWATKQFTSEHERKALAELDK